MNKTNFYPIKNSAEYQFIQGKPIIGCSISEQRLDHLKELSRKNYSGPIKVAMRDIESDSWTRWNVIELQNDYLLENAYEIHRTLCDNEILIESDYPDYKDNVEATQFIGEILENKGYKPHYYFSGGNSIHIHIWFDFDFILTADKELLRIIGKFHISTQDFLQRFIIYLRELMISCWDTDAREFDKGLINPQHLIRSELSRNKRGYKTFLGYECKSLSGIENLCNIETTNYPEIATSCEPNGEIQHKLYLSQPNNLDDLLQGYIAYRREQIAKETEIKKNWARHMKNNQKFINNKKLRPMVEFILSDKFKENGDGFKRGMFILVNELLRINSTEEVRKIMYDWNLRMGMPIDKGQIDYRVDNSRSYKFSNKYIAEFLRGLGYEEWK